MTLEVFMIITVYILYIRCQDTEISLLYDIWKLISAFLLVFTPSTSP